MVVAPYSDAQYYLIDSVGQFRNWSVARIQTKEFRLDRFELQAGVREPGAQNCVGQTCLLEGIGPGECQRARCGVAVLIRHGDLIGVCWRSALDAEYLDAVFSILFDANGSEIYDNIRSDVPSWVSDLVEELFLHGLHGDHAAALLMLCDDN